ncbi:scavenger receptor cysteine-rich type 1 protein M130-like [Pempheris klunzingeri]|uniref:scavenger receptor cysteine-rich type 1 protein M130-like n=1 Tax=Pempheris klunzingeri TaxID=3127111 RepID=UPI0039809152
MDERRHRRGTKSFTVKAKSLLCWIVTAQLETPAYLAKPFNSPAQPEDLRLVRGTSRCAGELEVEKQREWNRVDDQMSNWNLKTADSESVVRPCVFSRKDNSIFNLEITCSDSVRLVDGNSLCSGRLEVKSDQLWSSVCEDGFDLLDAEVVCRELGCGAPSALQGALYGEVEAPVWSKEFQCNGRESALLDCRQSGSARDTCSPGKAVGLTCSAPDEVRLVGGASRCVGRLEMKHKGDWRPVADHSSNWDLLSAAVVCRQLGCGSALSTDRRNDTHQPAAWIISSFCGPSESALRECGLIWSNSSNSRLEVNCLDSIRLVDGNSLCSGRLEVKSDQLWSSVCEDDFDLQDAEVVCRELGCGAPSALQGALYGEGEAPVRSTEFLCDGQESALLDCGSSDSAADTCSSGKAVGLTCSELDNIRLTGGASRCDGTLEMKQHGEWRPVADRVFEWEQKLAPSVCRQLTCGSAVSAEIKDTSGETVWWIRRSCVQSDSTLRECLQLPSSATSYTNLEVLCSGSLAQPNISFSTHFEELSEANHQEPQVELGSRFIISCSFLPQYPGGFFQLILTTSATSQSSTLPAVGHSAHFQFPAADHSHQGEYRCVYRIYAFSQNVSFESQTLYVAVSAPLTDLVIRVLVLLLIMKFFAALLFFVFYCKSSRRRTPRREDNITLDYVNDARESLRE